MRKPLDPASPDPAERRERPPTLEEFAESLRQRLGPGCPVTISYPEPKTDGPIKTKFFFVNPRRNTDQAGSSP